MFCLCECACGRSNALLTQNAVFSQRRIKAKTEPAEDDTTHRTHSSRTKERQKRRTKAEADTHVQALPPAVLLEEEEDLDSDNEDGDKGARGRGKGGREETEVASPLDYSARETVSPQDPASGQQRHTGTGRDSFGLSIIEWGSAVQGDGAFAQISHCHTDILRLMFQVFDSLPLTHSLF